MITSLEHYVSTRFDAIESRFKSELSSDDFRLLPLLSLFDRGAHARVLDLGCGKGRFARALRERGVEVIGLDSSQAMLKSAESIDRVRARARRMPLASCSFDGVIAVEVFEHLPEAAIGETLDEIFRVLRPGGVAAVIDKNAGAADAIRPWLPALAVKWIDEKRGRWMYPPSAPFRERWFWPSAFRAELRRRFDAASVSYLISPDEARWRLFRHVPPTRRFALWTATKPGASVG
jgi:SAM-dependent methyltransferase